MEVNNMYSDYFNVNKNFQASVNLELDIGSDHKIDEYIPTPDICDVLNRYIKVALGKTKDYATTLIGPYGKGKSFLLLVLTYLLGKSKSSKSWIELVDKIKDINEELYKNLILIKQKDISLIPVIINSNYDNVAQSFQISLNEALKRESLNDILPKNAFDVCLELISKWEKNSFLKEDASIKCIETNKVTLKELKSGLKEYSPDAYNKFIDLYNCINIGLEFNPLINNDVVKTYSNLLPEIKKRGYSGFFVVFDEFSKFIEGNSKALMKDLKLIQDFAELSTRSSVSNQIHLCCVAHKSIMLYSDGKTKNGSFDSFKTVEGRFKEVRFNRSLEENYHIISCAIKKNGDSNKLWNKFHNDNKNFYEGISKLDIFNEKSIERVLFKGCFPLNPLTVYSLIQISEYSAQNERTLFTFLADTDDDSFNSFIHSNDVKDGLFNIDKIYDYFSPMLQKEDTNYIRNTWYRSESILSKLEDNLEKRIVKALAIILMINDFDKFKATEEVISLSLNLELNDVIRAINKLIDNHYLRKNPLSNLLSFALSNTKKIDENIAIYKQTKFKNIKYADFIEEINEHRFVLPRRYNEINKITRFFKTWFVEENDFINIKNLSYYFENNYCDGVVIYLLRNNISDEQIKDTIDKVNDKRLIVKYPSKQIDEILYESVLKYACLNEIKKQKGLDEVTIKEIDLLLEEVKDDCKNLLDKYFVTDYRYYSCLEKEQKSQSFNSLLSETMNVIYPVTLIFNNELVNKRSVTTQYQKAINHVIDWILDGSQEWTYSETSPETSIKVSVLDNNNNESSPSLNLRSVLNEIKDNITISNRKTELKSIINKYYESPYGIRLGVMPIILAKSISELSDNVILYYQTKEIEVNSANLVKACDSDKYQLSFSKSSAKQKKYLIRLLKLFNCETTNNFNKDVVKLTAYIKRYFLGLPQIVRLNNINNNYLGLDKSYIDYKNLFLSFNINPYEVIFEQPKIIFSSNDYDVLYDEISKIKDLKNNLLCSYESDILASIKDLFMVENGTSLKNGIKDFIHKYVPEGQTPILEESSKNIYDCLIKCDSYDDLQIINRISRTTIGRYIEDWDSNKSDALIENLKDFVEEIQQSKTFDQSKNPFEILEEACVSQSSMGSLMKNNIEAILDEFSGSVSTKEKLSILASLMKEIM